MKQRVASVMTIIESMPRFLVEKAQFLPKLLVLGCILDNFACFLPRLLDIIYIFALTRHKKEMIWHITRDIPHSLPQGQKSNPAPACSCHRQEYRYRQLSGAH
jgi:hypothetical protein